MAIILISRGFYGMNFRQESSVCAHFRIFAGPTQYCAHDYRKMLRQFGMQASMSRTGDCWGSLKNELLHHRRFATREQAKREITEYIEIFYNRIRKQGRLGYLSPAVFNQ